MCKNTDETFKSQLVAMAADPDIQRELSLIQAEFAETELDGLNDDPESAAGGLNRQLGEI